LGVLAKKAALMEAISMLRAMAFLLFFICCFENYAFAASISEISGPTTVSISGVEGEWAPGDQVIVFGSDGTEIALLKIKEKKDENDIGEIVSWLGTQQILIGQRVAFFDTSKKGPVSGRVELLQAGNPKRKEISARYRRLFYTNSSNMFQSAETLDRGEHVVSILGDYSYGITNRLTVGTIMLGNALLAFNLRAKYKFYDSEVFTISSGAHYLKFRDTSATSLTFYLDSPANPRLISHFGVSLSYIKGDKLGDKTIGLVKVVSSIEASSEYVLNGWNRILIGPKYLLESQKVGGFVNYVFLWDHLHLTIGVSSKNILALRDTSPDLMAYWRF
jgi:hypothetical protein